MRSLVPVVLALFLAAPVAAAGPISDLPVSEHYSECWSESTHEVGPGWDRYTYADSCAEGARIGARQGPVSLEIGERQSDEDRYVSHQEYDENGHRGGWTSEYARVEETYAAASAGAFTIEASDACGYGGEGAGSFALTDTGNDTHTWDVAHETEAIYGCWKSVSASAGSQELASATLIDGCRYTWGSEGVFEQHYTPEGVEYAEDLEHGGTSRCGDTLAAHAASEQIVLTRGTTCRYDGTYSYASGGESSASSHDTTSDCTEGVSVDGPAGTRADVGHWSSRRQSCASGSACQTTELGGGEGIRVWAVGTQHDMAAPTGALWLLP